MRSTGNNRHTEPPRHRRKKRSKRSAWRIVVIVLLTIGVLCCLGLAAYALWSRAPRISSAGLKDQSAASVEATASPEPTAEQGAEELKEQATEVPTNTPVPTPEPNMRRENVYTVLVVGRDRVGMNTDTIMVGCLDCDAGTLNVVNIPRDTLVNVPWAVKKINSVYGTLGAEGLVDAVEDLVGFHIDNYVIINTYIFQQLVDCIGGVYFDVPMYMYYDDPDQWLEIRLSPGYQLLNGYQAEQLVRFRQNNDGSGYGNGDLGRINTQQAFMKALAKQMLTLGNIANLPQIISIITEYTDTDLTSGNIAFFAEEFLKLDEDSIAFYTMPNDTVNIRGGSYVSIQLRPWLDMINACLNPFTQDVTEANLDVLTYSADGLYSTTGAGQDFYSFYDYYG